MNLYNDIDPKVCAWLRELIDAGLIPPGDVICKTIKDINPDELKRYTQCHFFCGIAGWSRALHLAGWPTDRPVWTGSCPCQPFSCAGKGKGQSDERHLWPEMFRLIRQCRPQHVFGEQVANAIGKGWLDGISADLESEGYACGAAVLGAHSVGAPHIRQRLYWVAKRVAHSEQPRLEGYTRYEHDRNEPGRDAAQPAGPVAQGGPNFWSAFDLIPCRDGKARRIPEPESILQPLFDGVSGDLGNLRDSCGGQNEAEKDEIMSALQSFPLAGKVPGRTMLLKGSGNAILPELAAEFIRAVMDVNNL
jgi:DNA (cytosine-5)-methyltransferase 1